MQDSSVAPITNLHLDMEALTVDPFSHDYRESELEHGETKNETPIESPRDDDAWTALQPGELVDRVYDLTDHKLIYTSHGRLLIRENYLFE